MKNVAERLAADLNARMVQLFGAGAEEVSPDMARLLCYKQECKTRKVLASEVSDMFTSDLMKGMATLLLDGKKYKL